MQRRAFGIGLSALCLSAVWLSVSWPAQAQAPTGNVAAKLVVEGCVQRAQPNGSVAGTGLGTTSSPNTADRDANSSELLNVFLLTDAKAAPASSTDAAPTSYGLVGHEQEFAKHTGHRVQVTGTLEPPRSSRTPADSAAAAGIRSLRVEQVKMVRAGCSADRAR